MNHFKIRSSIRLPFTPRNEALELKKEIREALSQLNAEEHKILYAYFAACHREFFDVENILFYDLGSGAFNKLSVEELCFELKHDPQLDEYEYFYGLLGQTPFSFEKGDLLTSFETELTKITSSLKPLDYWFLIKQGNFEQVANRLWIDDFALDIELGLTKYHDNLVALIKPMIDGVISSLHCQNNLPEHVVKTLSRTLALTEKQVSEMFSEKPYCILGERNLVSEYRKGIKWNPADERCTKVRVRQHIADKNVLKVKVYKVNTINTCERIPIKQTSN